MQSNSNGQRETPSMRTCFAFIFLMTWKGIPLNYAVLSSSSWVQIRTSRAANVELITTATPTRKSFDSRTKCEPASLSFSKVNCRPARQSSVDRREHGQRDTDFYSSVSSRSWSTTSISFSGAIGSPDGPLKYCERAFFLLFCSNIGSEEHE
jgi:hypothetical protein